MVMAGWPLLHSNKIIIMGTHVTTEVTLWDNIQKLIILSLIRASKRKGTHYYPGSHDLVRL